MNERFTNALNRVPQRIPPIWMMRQAGRYHAHYQRLRQTHSFMALCKEPRLAAEAALGPVQDFDFDAAILFSDLLFPLEALGMGLDYEQGGPRLAWRLNEETMPRLSGPDEALARLEFQPQAVAETRRLLAADKSLIGFVGGPWTLFAYAVEGASGRGLVQTKRSLPLFPGFCGIMVPLLIACIERQIAAGAEVVMIFDSLAGELAPDLFQSAVVPQLEKIAARAGRSVGYYSRGTQPAHLRDAIFSSGSLRGIGVDHRWRLSEAFEIGRGGFVQGNFDQTLLHLEKARFEAQLENFVRPLRELSPQDRAGWVCGLGHGVLPGTPEENVRSFVRRVREELA